MIEFEYDQSFLNNPIETRMKQSVQIPITNQDYLQGDLFITANPQDANRQDRKQDDEIKQDPTPNPLFINHQPTKNLNKNSGKNIVVFAHGLGGHRGGEKSQSILELCQKRGWDFARFDFRGHGESSGKIFDLSGPNLLADLQAVQTYLKSLGYSRFFWIGSSMGSWAVAWHSLLQSGHAAACIWLAPAIRFLHRRFEQFSEEELNQAKKSKSFRIRSEWLDIEIGEQLYNQRDQFPPNRLIQEWQLPLLIIHGHADRTIPIQESWNFFRSCEAPEIEFFAIKQGDHRLVNVLPDVMAQIERFLSSYW